MRWVNANCNLESVARSEFPEFSNRDSSHQPRIGRTQFMRSLFCLLGEHFNFVHLEWCSSSHFVVHFCSFCCSSRCSSSCSSSCSSRYPIVPIKTISIFENYKPRKYGTLEELWSNLWEFRGIFPEFRGIHQKNLSKPKKSLWKLMRNLWETREKIQNFPPICVFLNFLNSTRTIFSRECQRYLPWYWVNDIDDIRWNNFYRLFIWSNEKIEINNTQEIFSV